MRRGGCTLTRCATLRAHLCRMGRGGMRYQRETGSWMRCSARRSSGVVTLLRQRPAPCHAAVMSHTVACCQWNGGGAQHRREFPPDSASTVSVSPSRHGRGYPTDDRAGPPTTAEQAAGQEQVNDIRDATRLVVRPRGIAVCGGDRRDAMRPCRRSLRCARSARGGVNDTGDSVGERCHMLAT
jgi:hypothetical protein